MQQPIIRDKKSLVTKIILLIFLLAGLALIISGWQCMRIFSGSGFSSESAFQAIYSLSDEIHTDYTALIEPDLNALSPSAREKVLQSVYTALEKTWMDLNPDSTADVSLEKEPWKLLYITYQISGPKVSGSIKKMLSEDASVSTQILSALTGDTQLPESLASSVSSLEGNESEAMMFQLYFTSLSSRSHVKNEDINLLKKSVRDKSSQPAAFRMIAYRQVSSLMQFFIGNSRTVILAGCLLVLDVLLLAFFMAGERTWHMDLKWILILVIIDFLLLFQLLPFVYMLIKAIFPDGSFSLETLERLYTYNLNLDALKNTLIASGATMVLGTLIAFPLAWLVGRTNLYGRKFFRSLFVLTYMVPPYVGAMAWLRLLNPNVGTINQYLRVLFALPDTPGPLNVYSLPGLIWVLTTFYYPYAFITISRAMEKMDPSLAEACRISGASPLKTVLTVTLPLMLPSLISGALLVFVSAASCYGIPSIIGSPGRVHTVTTRIVEYVSLGQQSMNDATGLAIFLMLVALLILFLSDVVLAKKQFVTVSGKSVNPTIVDLRKVRIPLTVLVSLFALIVVLVPFVTILTTSLKIDVGKSALDPSNFTLSNWTGVFGRAETMTCLKNSVLFASAAATIGILIACTMSYLLQRTRIRGRKIPDFLITLGSGTPSVVIALGLIMTMKGNFGINIYNTAYIMIIAYIIKYLMMGMRTVVSAMSQIHISLEESSQISGASWSRTMLRITAPLIFPSIAAGWFLIFIPSFYELSMTTLLYASTTKTIGFQLYEYWTFTSQPMACAMAFGILLIVVILNFVLHKLTRGQFSI